MKMKYLSAKDVGDSEPKSRGYIRVDGMRTNTGRGSTLGWAFFRVDGSLFIKGTAYAVDPTDQEISRARSLIEHAIQNLKLQKISWKDINKPVYIRFGELPPKGHSYDYSTGRFEKGVSCFALTFDLVAGGYVPADDSAKLFGSLVGLTGRQGYIIEGRYAGVGADGEPVLSAAKIVRKADLTPIIETLERRVKEDEEQ